MDTVAVVLEQPEHLVLSRVALCDPGPDDVVVDVEWSGISTGTERLLWSGRMPEFPGMGYPLVPGYESVGRIGEAGEGSSFPAGTRVFVPGARCFRDVRGLFGGAAARLVVPAARVVPVPETLGEQAVLFALAATARHAVMTSGQPPDLIVGHGVLGRLVARVVNALGAPEPTVWESNADRADGALGYSVVAPEADARRDYRSICDVSGDPAILDQLIARLVHGGEVTLAGFYSQPLSFTFPPAFMREARIQIAAEWNPADLHAVRELVDTGRLSLEGLVTHRRPALEAQHAYRTAFGDPACLKMVLDWRTCT